MRVGRARIGYDENPRPTDQRCLQAKAGLFARKRQRAMKRPEAHEPVKTGKAWLIALELLDQGFCSSDEFLWRQLRRPRAWTLDDIGKAETVIEEQAILRRLDPVHAE